MAFDDDDSTAKPATSSQPPAFESAEQSAPQPMSFMSTMAPLAPALSAVSAVSAFSDGSSAPMIPDVFDTSKFDDDNPFKAVGATPSSASNAADPFASFAEAFVTTGGPVNPVMSGGFDEFDPFREAGATSGNFSATFQANFGGAAPKKRASKPRRKASNDGEGGEDAESEEGSEYNCDIDPEEAKQPLKPFHDPYHGQIFQMGLRQPARKTKMGPFGGNRGWRTTYVRFETEPKYQQTFLRLYATMAEAQSVGNNPAKPPSALAELKLEPHMTLSAVAMQPFDEYGKVYTTKIYHTDYKERPALRADKITPKGLSLTSIKDLKRLITKPKTTMVLDHAPQHDEVMKLGALDSDGLRDFRWCFQDAMVLVSELFKTE